MQVVSFRRVSSFESKGAPPMPTFLGDDGGS